MSCCSGTSHVQNYNKQGMTREERIIFNRELELKALAKKAEQNAQSEEVNPTN